jgi:hypothetical protein
VVEEGLEVGQGFLVVHVVFRGTPVQPERNPAMQQERELEANVRLHAETSVLFCLKHSVHFPFPLGHSKNADRSLSGTRHQNQCLSLRHAEQHNVKGTR